MIDKAPFYAAETGTYSTASPNPHVNLSGTAANFGTYPVRTFAQAAADTAVDFDSGHTCTVTVWKDASNYARYSGAVWTDASPDTIDLSAATLESSLGTLANNDSVIVAAGDPKPVVPSLSVIDASDIIDPIPLPIAWSALRINLDQATTVVSLPDSVESPTRLLIEIIQDATGSRAISWPAHITWEYGAEPYIQTAPNSVSPVDMQTIDGTIWYGHALWPASTLPPSPAYKLYDNFNRADSSSSLGNASSTGQTWSAVSGTWGISSNAAYRASGTGDQKAIIDAENNYTIFGGRMKAGYEGAAIVGWSSSDATTGYYALTWSSGGTVYFELIAMVSGATTGIVSRTTASKGLSVAVGDYCDVRVEINGATKALYVNNVLFGSGSNSAVTQTTKLALRVDASTSNARWDSVWAV